jgi:hypothetical protein
MAVVADFKMLFVPFRDVRLFLCRVLQPGIFFTEEF